MFSGDKCCTGRKYTDDYLASSFMIYLYKSFGYFNPGNQLLNVPAQAIVLGKKHR